VSQTNLCWAYARSQNIHPGRSHSWVGKAPAFHTVRQPLRLRRVPCKVNFYLQQREKASSQKRRMRGAVGGDESALDKNEENNCYDSAMRDPVSSLLILVAA